MLKLYDTTMNESQERKSITILFVGGNAKLICCSNIIFGIN